jgi:AraC-like DNA-binding protein/mannose-6-phosphate isomerase-like protein (cupin superfamily)
MRMGLQNAETHTVCYCYDTNSSVVLLKELIAGETSLITMHEQEILFILEGTVHISVDRRYRRTLKKDEFIFLPIGVSMLYRAETNSTMLSVRIIGDTPECHIFRLNKISERLENPYEGIYALTVNDQIRTFLSGLLATFNDGLRCRHYLKMEASRMLYLLHAYYPQEDHIKLFAPIVSPDVTFSEFVRMNWQKYSNVGEFADALCMTTQCFSSRFRRIFGVTPREWMTKQKAQRIYEDICRSDITLKEISIKHNFPLQSNFFRFCKQTFGESPGQIRLNLKNNQPPV